MRRDFHNISIIALGCLASLLLAYCGSPQALVVPSETFATTSEGSTLTSATALPGYVQGSLAGTYSGTLKKTSGASVISQNFSVTLSFPQGQDAILTLVSNGALGSITKTLKAKLVLDNLNGYYSFASEVTTLPALSDSALVVSLVVWSNGNLVYLPWSKMYINGCDSPSSLACLVIDDSVAFELAGKR
jgi:hypothetical protein